MTNVLRSLARSALPLVATAAVLAGCGGGRGSSTLPLPAQTSATVANARGTLALTIKIPRVSSSSVRRVTYISASTQSIAITITHATTTTLQEAVGLTPASNPNCSTSGNTTTCTITIGLAAGSYTGTFATYDGPVVSNAATGNVLSQGQSIPLAVTAGNTNTIAVTLDGIPASITIAPASGSTITGVQSSGFTVSYTAQPMTVDALDANNNVILGAGAPTFTATATASKFSVTQPTAGSPNTIMLSAVGGGSGTLSVTAAAPDAGFSCSAAGVVCTASASIATGPHTLYVANQYSMDVYQSTDNIAWTHTASQVYNPGYLYPQAITADANGNVVVFDILTGLGDVFTPPYIAGPFNLAGVTQPNSGTFNSLDQLLVADTSFLFVFASPFSGSPTGPSLPLTGLAVVTDSANDAIVSTEGGLLLFASPYTGAPTTINGSLTAEALTIGADNTVFVSSGVAPGQVLVYAPPYTSAPIALTLPNEGGSETAEALAVTANGNLWVSTTYTGSCPCNAYLFEYTKPFTASSTPAVALLENPNLGVFEVAADTTGDLITGTDPATISIINASGTTVGTITANVGYPDHVFYVK